MVAEGLSGVTIGERHFSAQELVSLVLGKLKKSAEKYFERSV
jgi:molecular chaperone DnaK (HSP70)